MYKILLLFLAFIPMCTYSQSSWNMIFNRNDLNLSHVTGCSLFNDSLIVIGGMVSDASCPYYKLFGINQQGQLKWEKYGYQQLVTSDKQNIYTAGYTPIDDVIGIELLVFAKYNENGDELDTIGFPDIPHVEFFEFSPQNIELTADGKLLVSSTHSVIKTDTAFSFIKEYQLSVSSDIREIRSVSSTCYFLSTSDHLYKTDTAFTITDAIELTSMPSEIRVIKDTLYCLFSNQLIRFNQNLNPIDTLLSSSSIKFDNMEFFNDKIWVKMTDENKIKLIEIQDSQIQDTIKIPKLSNVKDFLIADKNFTFVGESYNNQIAIYHFNDPQSSGTDVILPNIELVDFEIHNITFDYGGEDYDPYIIGYYFETGLTVRNNGNLPIHSFAVYAWLNGQMNCSHNYFYQKFTDIDIEPGMSSTFQLHWAYQQGIENNQLCFECLAPNDELESASSDNSLCKTFEIIGVDDNSYTQISVYPNPVTNQLFVNGGNEIVKQIEISNIGGQTIYKSQIEGQNSVNINELSSGVFLVKIITEKGASVFKIIKQ